MSSSVEHVGAGCHAWLRLPGSWGETNIGLVCGDGASLLVDTPWDHRLTLSMLEAFRPELEKAPVAIVFNTHADPDHWWGNADLPSAEVVASDATASAMRHEPTPRQLQSMRQLSQVGGRLPGRAGRGGRYVGEMLAPFAFEEVTLRFADRTFTDRRTETVGGREIELIDYGPAHTVSDSVVFVPDARVVYTGDLLFAGVTPVMWHGPVTAWLAVLEAIMALEADVFVAGHGRVSGRAELAALRDYWGWLASAVQEHQGAGVGASEMATRLADSQEFAAFRGWVSPERLWINVATIDRQLRGEGPIPTNAVARGRAFDGVAGLAHHLG